MDNKVRIYCMAPYRFIPNFGGGQRDIFYSLQAMQSKSVLKCLTVKSNPKEGPFKIENSIPDKTSRYINLFLIRKILGSVKEFKTQVMFVFHPFIAWQAILVKKFYPTKIVIRSQNIEYERFRSGGKWFWKIIRAVEHWAHKKADHSFFITEEDLSFAIKHFPLDSDKCSLMPYGMERLKSLSTSETLEARAVLENEHAIESSDKILLFNGTLSYFPNEKAVEHLVNDIHPFLENELSDYKVVICGKGLRSDLIEAIDKMDNIIYTGFVDDIDVYFKACDVLINPVVEGGGVKTKLVEALGFGKAVVSYTSGSYGVDPEITSGRLRMIEDYNATEMVKVCIEVLQNKYTDDNAAFYEVHNWQAIGSKAVEKVNALVK